MKTSFLISAVVAAHVLAVGSAFLIQGCGTTRGPADLPTGERPMPPKVGLEPVEPVTAEPVEVEPAEDQPAAPDAKTWTVDATTTYVVGKGDTLSHIAQRYDLTVAEIMTLNNIANPDAIRIGQKLILPGEIDIDAPEAAPAPSPARAETRPLPAGANVYVVQPGDCLSVIAARAGVKTKALREANNLQGDKIYVGQKLAIPGGGAVAPVAPAPADAEPSFAPVSPVLQEDPADLEVPELPVAVDDELPMTDLAPEPPAAAGSASPYTVKAGDDILSVASEHNVSIADLRRVNQLSSDLLVPGQRLIIPTQD
jgi:D-gamma-glutamyl-meso-diaminopimelic acid endopeptidase CwlS